MTARERAEAIQRAEEAMRNLRDHQATSCAQLGAARDQLNIVRNWGDTAAVWDSVYVIESIVLEVYGTPPPPA